MLPARNNNAILVPATIVALGAVLGPILVNLVKEGIEVLAAEKIRHDSERLSVVAPNEEVFFKRKNRRLHQFSAVCIASESGQSGVFKERKGEEVIHEFIMPPNPLEQAKLCFNDKIDRLDKMRGDKEVLKKIFSEKLTELTDGLTDEQIKFVAKQINDASISLSSAHLNPKAGTGYAIVSQRGFFRSHQIILDPTHPYTKQHLNLAVNNFLTKILEQTNTIKPERNHQRHTRY